MKDLEQALAFANYQSTLNRERQLITQRYNDKCILPYNGGLFKLTFEFLAAAKTYQGQWLLDMNNNPVQIVDLADFCKLADQTYLEAITEFGESYASLKTKRSVKSLVGL